jgi:hypothetical protein
VAFAIKAEVRDPLAETFAFTAQKSMYGAKRIAEGDTIFVFARENKGGRGLVARGVVTSAETVAKTPDVDRQTPRVTLAIRRTALSKRPLGRREPKHFIPRNDGRPDTKLNFKFYRQATNKIISNLASTLAALSGSNLPIDMRMTGAFIGLFFPASCHRRIALRQRQRVASAGRDGMVRRSDRQLA